MAAEALSFAGMIVCVRHLSLDGFSAFEIAFFRTFIGLCLLVPWLLRHGKRVLVVRRKGLIAARSLTATAGQAVWFLALGMLVASDAVALQFTGPLFVLPAAAIFLRERVDAARWTALFVGFIGAMIIIRPGFAAFHPGMGLVMIVALFYAAIHIMTKKLSSEMSGTQVVFWFNAVAMPLSLVPALFGWKTPGLGDVVWILGVALCGTLAQIFMTRAFAAADASFVSPIDFLKLPFTALLGWLLFNELSDMWTWIGAGIIFAATTVITRRESRARPSVPASANTEAAGS